jgi:hypothetical protein
VGILRLRTASTSHPSLPADSTDKSFVVGSAIVLLGWVIPARIGLSMEFSVALMLILLGIMNLTGFLHWINGRFSSAPGDQIQPHSHPRVDGDYIYLHPHTHTIGRATTALQNYVFRAK